MANDNKDPKRFITGRIRFSYVHVFEPYAMDANEEAKYSVALLIPKDDTVTLARYEAALQSAKEDGKTRLWKGKIPGALKLPLRDGDADKPNDEAYKGCYFINAISKVTQKPGVVDANLNPIINAADFYSGCYGRAGITLYPFAGKQFGVACGLNNLQKLADGVKLSGGSTPEDDFSEPEEDF